MREVLDGLDPGPDVARDRPDRAPRTDPGHPHRQHAEAQELRRCWIGPATTDPLHGVLGSQSILQNFLHGIVARIATNSAASAPQTRAATATEGDSHPCAPAGSARYQRRRADRRDDGDSVAATSAEAMNTSSTRWNDRRNRRDHQTAAPGPDRRAPRAPSEPSQEEQRDRSNSIHVPQLAQRRLGRPTSQRPSRFAVVFPPLTTADQLAGHHQHRHRSRSTTAGAPPRRMIARATTSRTWCSSSRRG